MSFKPTSISIRMSDRADGTVGVSLITDPMPAQGYEITEEDIEGSPCMTTAFLVMSALQKSTLSVGTSLNESRPTGTTLQ